MSRKGLVLVGLQAAVVGVAVAFLWVGLPTLRAWLKTEITAPSEDKAGARLGANSLLILEPEAQSSLGIQSVPAAPAGKGAMSLTGSLALDPNRLARVRSRFPGEIIKIAINPRTDKPWQSGDRIHRGELLAEVWSKDLGEKKSELLDALSQLRQDRDTLKRLEPVWREGGLPEARWREAQRSVEASTIAASKAERTLRSWRLDEKEIAELRAEAERLHKPGATDPSKGDTWARVLINAPQVGTILERTANVGELVDPAVDLFKIADLSQLTVWAHLYEEDLPRLLSLGQPIAWTIQPKNMPEISLPGVAEKIGQLVDPTQHTVLVTGRVDNHDGNLRSGQFITATIALPADKDDLVIPTTALAENGEESIVFIQPNKDKAEYALRHVTVRRRQREWVHISSGLQPGDLVVVTGAGELRTILENLPTQAAKNSD